MEITFFHSSRVLWGVLGWLREPPGAGMLHEHVQRVEAVLDGVTPSPVAQHRQRLALDQPTVGDARQVDSRPVARYFLMFLPLAFSREFSRGSILRFLFFVWANSFGPIRDLANVARAKHKRRDGHGRNEKKKLVPARDRTCNLRKF